MICGHVSDVALAEKLAPPRPLQRVGEALYAPPLGTSKTAYIAWMSAPNVQTLQPLVDRARTDGARTLRLGGPPGNYLVSGIRRDDPWCGVFESLGFTTRGQHVELTVSTESVAADTEVVCVQHVEPAVSWIQQHFGNAWAMEAERAFQHRGLFVAHNAVNEPVGFAAHSGNRAWTSTFGPIGVLENARGARWGKRLAATVFADLRALGFVTATVPWVDEKTAEFYARFFTVTQRVVRLEMALDVDRD
jgi:GNAT superfamily N-acetyltransferase